MTTTQALEQIKQNHETSVMWKLEITALIRILASNPNQVNVVLPEMLKLIGE